MLARVAGNLFWFGRYLERAEVNARLLEVQGNLLMDLPRESRDEAWGALVAIAGLDELFVERGEASTEASISHFLMASEHNPSSVLSALRAARFNLRAARDRLPTLIYESANQTYLSTRTRIEAGIALGQRPAFLKDLQQQLRAITGGLEGSMSHGLAYRFLRLGGFLERADMTSRILDVRSANLLRNEAEAPLVPFENREWAAVLRSMHASQMYVTNVRKPINGPDILKYLLTDRQLPRAYQFCLLRLSSYLKNLDGATPALEKLVALTRKIEQADIATLAANKPALHEFLDTLQIDLNDVAQAISERYFPSDPD